MYKFVANIKEYTLLESVYGTYKITKDSKSVAHPPTEEDAWQRIKWLTGNAHITPNCWDNCRIRNCYDCDRYED